MSTSPQPIETKVKNRIYGKGRGWTFTQKDLEDLGAYFGIRKALLNLESDGFIRRVSTGIYDYPEQHKVLGILPPKLTAVAEALSRRDKVKIQPSGAQAANQLGLTEQVPAKVVYLTSGNAKKVRIGKQELIFRATTPKRLLLNDRKSGLVIEALKYLGKNGITETTIKRLSRILTQPEKEQLKKDAHFAPAWIRTIIEKDIYDLRK